MRPKWFLSLRYVWRKPCTYLVPILTLSVNGLKWDSTWPTWPRSFHQLRAKRHPSLWFVQRKSCIYLASGLAISPNGPEPPLEPRHLGVPSGGSKMISKDRYIWRKPSTNLTPTLTPSPNKPKWDSTWPMLHRCSIGCPKRFLSLWYVRRKPCTYHTSRLAVYLNRQNRASTRASSPRSTIGCVQNDPWAYGTFGANRAPILHRY
jgi:hypothetical protein